MHSRLHFLIQAAPLMLVLFIDSIGLGLIIPVLNGLIFNPNSHFLNESFSSPFMHNLAYGFILGIFMLCWFFGSVILGDLSDKIGRKHALLICLAGSFLSYLISALAVSIHSLALLLLGRIINGLTSGSQPIAQAAVVDISHPEQKARNMSYMFCALSLGFILGPLFGGLFSDPNLIRWFNFSMPFYFAALLTLTNIILLALFFKETYVTSNTKISIRLTGAINLFISAFKHPKVRIMATLYTIFIFGWSSFYSFISAFLMKNYLFTSTQISLYMGLMGVGFAIGNGLIVEYLSSYLSEAKVFCYATFAAALFSFLIVFLPYPIASWLLIAPMATCIAVTGPAVMTLFSNQVNANEQGWVMGITGSIMALVWAFNSVAVGAAATWSAAIPIYTAGTCLFISGLLTPYFLKKLNHT